MSADHGHEGAFPLGIDHPVEVLAQAYMDLCSRVDEPFSVSMIDEARRAAAGQSARHTVASLAAERQAAVGLLRRWRAASLDGDISALAELTGLTTQLLEDMAAT